MLDLGDVRELADVSLNGKFLGTVWTPPFQVDIGNAIHAGRNMLQVKVANLLGQSPDRRRTARGYNKVHLHRHSDLSARCAFAPDGTAGAGYNP